MPTMFTFTVQSHHSYTNSYLGISADISILLITIPEKYTH